MPPGHPAWDPPSPTLEVKPCTPRPTIPHLKSPALHPSSQEPSSCIPVRPRRGHHIPMEKICEELKEKSAPGLPRPRYGLCCMSLMGAVMGRNWTFTYPQIPPVVKNGQKWGAASGAGRTGRRPCRGQWCSFPASSRFLVPCSLPPPPVHPWGVLAVFKDVSGFAAPPLVAQGIAVVAVGYDVAPKGHMDEMVAQVRRSVAFIAQQHPQLSGVYLCGHSAGAHLAAMVLSTNWEEYGVTPDIRGAFLVSGVYDLEPITHTYVNNLLHMSREVARRNSPILCVAAVEPAREACEVLIVVAQHDSLEFHRQSQEYFQALCSAGWRVSLLDVADMDHFDVIEKLSQESYILTRMVLNMITRAGI
ncbi:kynurenine formamidase isoform X3 [Carettochelys insculpta]|uniref:kynurenine formamidase isoform X3 n=1 Tax=Carettochelys insculpta TaxID=44489 RepID=UPI003EBEC1C3